MATAPTGITYSLSEPTPTAVPDDADAVLEAIFDPHRRGELYPLYHRLREVAPVHRSTHRNMPGVWMVSSFAGALDIYRNPRAVSDPAMAEHFNHGGAGGAFYRMLRQMMLFLESEQHAQVRRIVVRAFTPRSIAQVQPITEHYANVLLDEIVDRGAMDLVAEFATPLPFRVIAHVLGVPEADFPLIAAQAYDFARGSELSVVADDRSRRADDAAVALGEYFAWLIERRRSEPRDDVLTSLIALEDDGTSLDHEQLVATAVLLMQAGHETTADTIGNSLVALLQHPAQRDLLRADASITKSAVEELLRFDPTNQMNSRLLLDDVEVEGVRMHAGDHVTTMIGAANRDPAVFADPDVLDLRRDAPQHLAFAFGAYYCVGNALARAEVAVALRTLLDRLPNLHAVDGTYVRRDTLRNRGLERFALAW